MLSSDCLAQGAVCVTLVRCWLPMLRVGLRQHGNTLHCSMAAHCAPGLAQQVCYWVMCLAVFPLPRECFGLGQFCMSICHATVREQVVGVGGRM